MTTNLAPSPTTSASPTRVLPTPRGRALAGLSACDTRFDARMRALPPDRPELAHALTVAAVHDVIVATLDAEAAGLPRPAIIDRLRAVRAWHRRSPFVHRLQTWPRGTVGDFETIRYLLDGENRATGGTAAMCLEEYGLRCPAAQQHRHKLAWQTEQIRVATQRTESGPGDRPARVLSLGGGAAVEAVAAAAMGCAFEFTLNDTDPDALDTARADLAGSAVRLHPEPGNPLRSAARRRDTPFDLVLAGGLFDYLPEKHFRRVVAGLCAVLAPGGRLCFTNIATGNPYRPWMEYAADWQLIHRTVDELSAAVPTGHRARITREPAGLTWLVAVEAEA